MRSEAPVPTVGQVVALNPAPVSSTTGAPPGCGRQACTRVVVVAVSISNSSRGCGQSANARSYAAMNFSRAASLTHDPTSALGASMSRLLAAEPVIFMIPLYHQRGGPGSDGYGGRVPKRVDHEERRRQIAEALLRT